MEIKIIGTTEEIKELFQATANSKEQPIKINLDGKKVGSMTANQAAAKFLDDDH